MISRVIVAEVKNERNNIHSDQKVILTEGRRFLEMICMKRLEGNEELLLVEKKGVDINNDIFKTLINSLQLLLI